MHDEGLQLEEYDVDRIDICTERLKQLLMVENETIITPTKQTKKPSIPSSKATRFGGGIWNLTRLPCERSMCRSADFYEVSHRNHARSASEPDLPRRSDITSYLLVKPKHPHDIKDEQNLVIEGRTALPHIETPPSRAASSYTRRSTNSTHQLRLSTPFREDQQMFPPLSARQCFPGPKTISQTKEDNKKIKPMKRNMNFNKYFQSRFGRNLEKASDDLLNKINRQPVGREYKKVPEQSRKAIQNVVEQILRPRAESYGKDSNEWDKTLEGSLKCTRIKSE